MLASCQDDFTTSEVIIPDIPNPSVTVESSVLGKIVDLDGNPIPDTEVILAGETRLSNELGYFQFDKIKTDRYGSLLTAEKTGYNLGLRRVSLHAGTTNYVELSLLSDSPLKSFSSGESATVDNDEGLTLSFQPNSISTSTGQAYNGTVNISMHYIDPTASNINSLLPGSLQGFTDEGSLTTLKSYSMISVELTDDSGDELQVKKGETVIIEFPIPNELVNNAPHEIPLWYLDENSGIWIEEGRAELVGDHYVGEVSHFSYWNCDLPEDFVTVEGSVCNTVNGTCEALSFSEITILDSDNEIRQVSRTDSDGNFTLFIPKNAVVTIDFIKECDDINDQVNIGPFAEDQNVGQIDINADITEVQIIADVFSCDGSLLADGFLLINDQLYVPIRDGKVSEILSVCSEDAITVIAFNADFSRASEVMSLSFSENIMTTLSLCEEQVEGDFIFVRATNFDNLEDYTHLYLINRFQPCGEITTIESVPDGPDKITYDYISSIQTLYDENIDIIETGSIYIGFNHGESCETTGASDIILDIANPTMPLGDGLYDLVLINPDLLVNDSNGANDDSNVELNLISYGQEIGDVIEGTIKGDRIIAKKYTREDDPIIGEQDGVSYSVEINFRYIIK